MKAEELRIGNLVLYPDGFSGVVAGVHPISGSDITHLHDIQNGKRNGWASPCYLDLIKPIPLSEEWLERFGFNDKHHGYWTLFGSWWKFENGVLVCNGESDYIFNGLEFVHQLQNLHFALECEELTPQSPTTF